MLINSYNIVNNIAQEVITDRELKLRSKLFLIGAQTLKKYAEFILFQKHIIAPKKMFLFLLVPGAFCLLQDPFMIDRIHLKYVE